MTIRDASSICQSILVKDNFLSYFSFFEKNRLTKRVFVHNINGYVYRYKKSPIAEIQVSKEPHNASRSHNSKSIIVIKQYIRETHITI